MGWRGARVLGPAHPDACDPFPLGSVARTRSAPAPPASRSLISESEVKPSHLQMFSLKENRKVIS